MGGLIVCYMIIDDDKKAEKYFSKAEDINTQIVTDFYRNVGYGLFRSDHFNLSRDAFFKQLDIEKENENNRAIINTLTNIGLSYFYEGAYAEALTYFDQAIDHNGVDNLFDPVETLSFRHLSSKFLKNSNDKKDLQLVIEEFEDKNVQWNKNKPWYINWALYECFGDKKYISMAYEKLMKEVEKIDPKHSELFLSYSMQRKILESFKKLKNT